MDVFNTIGNLILILVSSAIGGIGSKIFIKKVVKKFVTIPRKYSPLICFLIEVACGLFIAIMVYLLFLLGNELPLVVSQAKNHLDEALLRISEAPTY